MIGVRSEIILRRFLTELPVQFEVADGDVRIDGVLVDQRWPVGRPRSRRIELRC